MPARARSPSVQLQVFGPPAVAVQGRPAPLPLQRAAALLAYLAFHPGPVPRAHLAALLWPDVGEEQARTRLRRLVYNTERAVGREILASSHEGVALVAAGVEVDALQFAAFARGVVAAAAQDDAALADALHWVALARRPLLKGIAFG